MGAYIYTHGFELLVDAVAWRMNRITSELDLVKRRRRFIDVKKDLAA